MKNFISYMKESSIDVGRKVRGNKPFLPNYEKKPPDGKLVKESKNNAFEIGQRVIYHYNYDPGFTGNNKDLDLHVGSIIKKCEFDIFGVEFDNWYNGHNCGGIGKSRQCYNVSSKELELFDPIYRIRWYKDGKLENEN